MTTATQALADARRPRMPIGLRYLVFHSPGVSLAKPFAFPSEAALAKYLHRLRGEDAIQVVDVPLLVQGEDAPRHGASVWTVIDGERARYLGWVYLGGAGRQAVQAALTAAQPAAQLAEAA